MSLSRNTMLERAAARDASYDGRFITGVLSTGIYCLPSCSARTPKPENIRFFRSPQKAEAAGLRACMRCKPDAFYAGEHPERDQLVEIMASLQRDPTEYADARALARVAGVGATKLNELFRHHYHVSPAAALQRARIRRACNLLIETDQKVIDVALDSGFESSSAFHENFRRATGLSPTTYRRLRSDLRFSVDLPEDFRIDEALHHLARDTDSPTDEVSGRSFARALEIDGRSVQVDVSLRKGRAQCIVDSQKSVSPAGMAEVHRTIRHMLGLSTDPASFEASVRRVARWRGLVASRPGLRVPQVPTVFEGFTWAIVGQQVNLPFARTLRRRVIELAGRRVRGTELCSHPTAKQVAKLDYEDLTSRQFSRRKAEYLIDGARRVVAGELDLESYPERPASSVEEELMAVRGIGVWSAQYLMMRACAFADCLPVGDSGLRSALRAFLELESPPDGRKVSELMAPLAPFRSLATYHLWMTLGESG